MSIKTILSTAALAGALATASTAAQADHDRRERTSVRQRDAEPDFVGTAVFRRGRGTVEFKMTPNERRDGLQLVTDAEQLRVRSIELEYSDGKIVTFRGSKLRDGLVQGQLLTIQRGRPPGLRIVRVTYSASNSDRGAKIALVQIHDGDGYTKEGDRDFDANHFDQQRRVRGYRW
jgi:hypothetical protein